MNASPSFLVCMDYNRFTIGEEGLEVEGSSMKISRGKGNMLHYEVERREGVKIYCQINKNGYR